MAIHPNDRSSKHPFFQLSARSTLVALAVLGGVLAACSSVPPSPEGATPLYLNPAEPLERRLDDLVGRMSLEEKASQLVTDARAIPRLGIPEYNWWSEALHGVAALGRKTTVFPEPIGLAASFDAPVVLEMAHAIGTEGRAYYNSTGKNGRRSFMQGITYFSPNINIFRDPRWGRGQETYGEDPWLTARMGVAFIQGLQAEGDDPRYLRATATAKHYAVHSGPELGRLHFNTTASAHDLEDTYLPAFRAAVVDGHVRSVMCVYNAFSSVPGCANDFLIGEKLRKQWHFDGFVVSDCGAVDYIHSEHHYAASPAEAHAKSLRAGVDVECTVPRPGPEADYQPYLDAVHQGLLTEAEIDAALKRSLSIRFALGMFDPPERVKYSEIPKTEIESEAHAELALRMARESMVLLKNKGLLPLVKPPRKIAVFGTLANQTPVLLGNYNGTPSHPVTVLEGLKAQFKDTSIAYEPGTNFGIAPEPVPDEVLSTDEGAPGVKEEIFDEAGKPALSRIVPRARSSLWSDLPPQLKNAPMRWSGWLTPKESGTYQLGLRGAGGVLQFENKEIVDARGLVFNFTDTAAVEVQAGHRYRIVVDLPKAQFRSLQLVWLREVPQAELARRIHDAAKDADMAIAVVGITSELESEESPRNDPGFRGGDRTSLDLPKAEEALLKAIKASGKPLIVVLMNGSALSVNWAARHADAILEAWYPGQAGGTAIAETLAGLNNPAGRLPVTFYKGVEQLPAFEDYSMANRTYRYFAGKPLYPFGYGLSYSRFSYDSLGLSAASIKAGEPLTVTAKVRNTSDRAGDEVVQLYLGFPKLAGAPRRALRGFTRIHLGPGETQSVTLQLSPRDLSYVDEQGQHWIGDGRYEISVGGGLPDTEAPRVRKSLTIIDRYRLDS